MITFHDVSLGFDNKPVLTDLNLQVASGEKILVSGKSGCGKTTLLRLILGIVQPDKGSVAVDGEPVSARTVWDIRKRTAYVDQEPKIGSGRIEDIVTRIFSFKANSGRGLGMDAAEEYFDFLELDKTVLSEDYGSLSGGEKQRISILIALLLERDIFLLDEATSALDEDLKKKVAGLFMTHPGWTVVAVSHDIIWRRYGAVRAFRMENR